MKRMEKKIKEQVKTLFSLLRTHYSDLSTEIFYPSLVLYKKTPSGITILKAFYHPDNEKDKKKSHFRHL